jgi:hypothetical protein
MSDDAKRERERKARERATHDKRVFASASFAPYGLDARWSGLRWIGGHGESNGRVSRLELAHGDNPRDPAFPQIRVETHLLESAGRDEAWDAARDLVQHFWHETGVLPERVRRALFPVGPSDLDPFGPWDSFDLVIDGATVVFRVLAHDDFWVGFGSRDASVVAVRAKGWPLDQTGIVRVDDLGPYFDRSVEATMRWRSR